MEQYFAFISYKRGGINGTVANWLHTKLEKYPYPSELVATENRPDHDTFIRKIFIDTKDLPVNENNFSDEIKEALENSRYLIVVCSKLAAQSKYVNNEVLYFLQTHDNDLSKILPVFIDSIEEGLPESLNNTDILRRHCPIYNSFLDATNEINLYCFYYVVAFLLKVDFRSIYDRYKRYSEKKKRKRVWTRNGIYVLIVLVFVFLLSLLHSQYQLIQKQKEIVELEKEIFPYSVVKGYVDNFMEPVIGYIKEYEPEAHIYVHMPTHEEDLNNSHKDRFDQISAYVKEQLSLDSISKVRLKTKMPRGSLVHRLYSSSNEKLNHKYLDFASTTSTFLAIAQKKQEKKHYANVKTDDMIQEYTNIFITEAKKELKNDSIYVTFVEKIPDILREIQK